MEVWDFLHNHQVPILNIKVADSPLNCLKVIDGNSSSKYHKVMSPDS